MLRGNMDSGHTGINTLRALVKIDIRVPFDLQEPVG